MVFFTPSLTSPNKIWNPSSSNMIPASRLPDLYEAGIKAYPVPEVVLVVFLSQLVDPDKLVLGILPLTLPVRPQSPVTWQGARYGRGRTSSGVWRECGSFGGAPVVSAWPCGSRLCALSPPDPHTCLSRYPPCSLLLPQLYRPVFHKLTLILFIKSFDMFVIDSVKPGSSPGRSAGHHSSTLMCS